VRQLGLALLALALLVPATARSAAPAPLHAELGARAGIYDDAGARCCCAAST
jgi:hypothetical protein